MSSIPYTTSFLFSDHLFFRYHQGDGRHQRIPDMWRTTQRTRHISVPRRKLCWPSRVCCLVCRRSIVPSWKSKVYCVHMCAYLNAHTHTRTIILRFFVDYMNPEKLDLPVCELFFFQHPPWIETEYGATLTERFKVYISGYVWIFLVQI